MQSKTFTIQITSTLTEVELYNSFLLLNLIGTSLDHEDLEITISNAETLNTIPIPSTPAVLEVVQILSPTILIKVTHPTSLTIDDVDITFSDFMPYQRSETAPMESNYKPFHNYYDGDGSLDNDINYNSAFRTSSLNLTETGIIDSKLQFSYDQSVNFIFSDDVNPVRLVNSRWILSEDGSYATIADRNQTKDTNTYSDFNFHRTELIPTYSKIPKVQFKGVFEGGKLEGGGYRYYFRYLTSDGAETDICEESRLVEVHKGDTPLVSTGATPGDSTDRLVSFTLTNLDDSFYAIRVYYTISSGDFNAVSAIYKLLNSFTIEDGVCNILHTGYENQEVIRRDILNIAYSDISNAKTVATANNRLLLGNIDIKDLYNQRDAIKAASCTIGEERFDIKYSKDLFGNTNENYSDPLFTYDKLGYWRGETYELGVVLVSGNGNSVAYPLHGIDNLYGDAVYDLNLIGNSNPGFYAEGENSLGVYRTAQILDDLWVLEEDNVVFKGTNLKVKINSLIRFPEGVVTDELTHDTDLSVSYDQSRDKYYINGTSSVSGLGGNVYLIAMVNCPHPTSLVTLNFINKDGTATSFLITTEGAVLAGGDILIDTDIGSQIGTTSEDLGYDGFFFVRRKRKKDKLMQGLLTPTASISTASSYFPQETPCIAGNWLGLGNTSKPYGTNVTMVPAPNCLMPFGTESFFYTQAETANVDKSGYADFVLKAPILDYEQAKTWSFYSPDIDCNTVGTATIFDGSKRSININTEDIFTNYHFVDNTSESSTTDRTQHLVQQQPQYITLNSPYTNAQNFNWKYPAEIKYVETGSFDISSMGFSGKSDRNIYLWLETRVTNKPALTYYINQADSATNPFNYKEVGEDNWEGFRPVGGYVEDDSVSGSADPKLDSHHKEGQTPGNAVNYGRYLGIKLPNYIAGLEGLNMNPALIPGRETNEYTNNNYEVSYVDVLADDNSYSYGYIADIYEGERASPIQENSWTARYLADESTEYFSISRRYTIDEFDGTSAVEVQLYEGDCYLGQQWKQVWSPLGIEEAPQATEMDPYRTDRRALGLLNYGFAIPIPAQSNYNFHMRTKERADEREYKVYGKDRSFLPVKKDIRGDKLIETGTFNFGYDINDVPDVNYFRLNSDVPYVKITYPNRIYASNPGIENEFWNGFTVFTGLNFKDYNSELGAITKVITVNNFTYVIYHHGIAQVGINERTMVSQDTGGVFADSAEILAARANIISDAYGSQHLHSMVGSSSYLYGVDALNKKVWRTSQKGASLVSDFKVATLVTEIIDWMQDKAIEVGGVFDIFGTYDLIKGDIAFTFLVHGGSENFSRTLVFNETLGIWICETDDTRKFFFKSKEDRYSFPSLTEEDTFFKYYRQETNLRKSYYNKFYGNIYDARIGYSVIDDSAVSKIFENIFIIGNNSLPHQVEYNIEDVNAKKIQSLVPSTNISYTFPTGTVTGAIGNDYFETTGMGPIILKWNGEPLGSGDFITVYNEADPPVPTYFVCMGYEYIGGDPGTLYVDKQITEVFSGRPLVLGYPNPIRLSTSIYEDTFGKIVCRTLEPKPSDSTIYTPRGKWVQIRLDYEGMSPMFLDRIVSSYSTGYS